MLSVAQMQAVITGNRTKKNIIVVSGVLQQIHQATASPTRVM